MSDPLKVLLVGATGVFGSRLAELVSGEAGVNLTLAARKVGRLEALAGRLRYPVGLMRIDRDRVKAIDLLGFDLVVDAAGPFQSSNSRLIEAAIGARVHYLDLADGRDFVAAFPRFDAQARDAGVTLVTGASSIPALSHAVIDELTAGWNSIDSVRVGIFPGNRAPRGRAVVQAILSYVGRPVRVFREGEWQNLPGWGGIHREDIPRIGKRWASVCDTPEQDLLVERYHPRRSAEFFAGVELGLLHIGLWLCSLPVRWGWLASLQPFAVPMLKIAEAFRWVGSDRGAMTVRVSGEGHAGEKLEKIWTLRADANRGPYVPVLAGLAMIRLFRDGKSPRAGASVCSGILGMRDFIPLMEQFDMEQWCDSRDVSTNADYVIPARENSY